MNQKSNKLTVPDLISVGVFTALYFVLVTVATFACALLPGVGNILLPAVAALISGSVYMLLAAKLQKFGGITIMGLVMGLFFFVSGHFVLSFAANIICGVAADLVAAAGKYRSKKLLLASYVVVFLWPDRPDFAAVVHEIRLHSQPDGPRQGRRLHRHAVCTHQQRQLCGQHAGNFDLRPCGRLLRPEDAEEAL